MSTPSQTRVAVVTGGAGALGSAIGARLALDGYDVVLLDRDGDAVTTAAEKLSTETRRPVAARTADVSDETSVRSAVDDIASTFGRLDCLVNNAAINPRGTLAQQTQPTWDAVMAVNVRGPMMLCQATQPLWEQQGWGRVVNLTSRTWLGGGPTSYVTSKAAVVGLTRTLAVELGPLGVTVNAVAPSMIETPFTRGGRSDEEFATFVGKHTAMTPMRRLAVPDDIAHAVAFLAGEHAGFITGEVLHVCGGAQLAASA